MKSKRMVRILALVVVLSMILTTAVFAAPGKKDFESEAKRVELTEEDYEHALQSLIEKEIVKGFGKGDYGLSGNVKRGDVIVMIIRALELQDEYNAEELSKNYLELEDFDDVKDKEAYYYGPIKMAKKLGIAKGDGRYFKPNKPVTVQEVIWLIERSEEFLAYNFDNSESKRIDELTGKYDEKELNNFAKRRDVIWMLNYVLEGIENENENDNKKADLTDIKLDMNDDSELKFVDSWFTRAYSVLEDSNSEVEDLEYIKFDLPVKNGKLYYDYDVDDDDDNDEVEEDTKYYLGNAEGDKIDRITLVPNKDFSGTITVKYYAIDEDDESYTGYMKITVDDDELLGEIEYETLENEPVNFDKDDFQSKLDEVQFELPNSKIGTLYFDDDNDDKAEEDESLGNTEKVDYEDLEHIIFLPYQNYDGEVVIKYIGINNIDDEEDETYHGEVVITVGAVQEITPLKFNADYDKDEFKIDFVDKLEIQVDDEDLFEDLDYVKFALPEEGTLRIKIVGKRLANVDANVNYELNKIEYIKYVFEDDIEDDSKVEINYTVYDNNTTVDEAYDGKFILMIDVE